MQEVMAANATTPWLTSQVDLVDDAAGGRHDAEVAECLLAPAQKLVALAVALELELGVALQGVRRAEEVHLQRVVDHQVDRDDRVDALRVAAHARHGRAHGDQVDHRRHAGEVLHDDARRFEGELDLRAARRAFQAARLATSSWVMAKPSHWRSAASSSTLIENGRRDTAPRPRCLERLESVVVGGASAGVECARGRRKSRCVIDSTSSSHLASPTLPATTVDARVGRGGEVSSASHLRSAASAAS